MDRKSIVPASYFSGYFMFKIKKPLLLQRFFNRLFNPVLYTTLTYINGFSCPKAMACYCSHDNFAQLS